MNEPRILIVHERETSVDYWSRELEKAARTHGGALRIEEFDFASPLSGLIEPLKRRQQWYDWMITDLKLDAEEEERPADARGVLLIQDLVAQGLFGGYRPRAQPPSGVRCIAACSVFISRGAVMDAGLERRLAELGVRSNFLCGADGVTRLAGDVCDLLQHEGLLGSRGAGMS